MFESILEFFSRPELANPWTGMWYLFSHGGWFVVGVALIKGLWELWFFEIKNHYASQAEYTLLAVNVPRATEQTPKAVENIFAHLAGLFKAPGTLYEQYWLGENQQNFAVEIVSRGGNIQFYCFIESRYRTVFEAAVFAQYPDAEIREAVDYTKEYPTFWPDEKYQFYGSELALMKSDVYPIKTHMAFVDSVTGTFKDPLTSLLEYMATLRPGEEVWIQIALCPVDDSWQEKSKEVVQKLIGAAPKKKKKGLITSAFSFFFDTFFKIFHLALGGAPISIESSGQKDQPPTLMMHLSPGEKGIIEQVQLKASKPGFLGKIRVVYIARKEYYNKKTFLAGTAGAFRQFSTVDLNAFKSDKFTKTKAEYVFTRWRTARKQFKLMRAYKGRSNKKGGRNYIFNIEELATLWHFPTLDTKPPLVSKSISKQAEPPVGLPVRDDYPMDAQEKKEDTKEEEELPDNIPFLS